MSALDAILAAWPAPVEERVGSWIARAGQGFTGRANTARPAPGGGDPADLPAVRDWYAARGLPPRLLLPDGVREPAGFRADGGALLLAGPLAAPAPGAAVALAPDPDADFVLRWLAWAGRGPVHVEAAARILAGVPRPRAFATAGDEGLALGVVLGATLVLECVATAPAARRRGVATRVCAELEAWAAARGARRVVLAVDRANDGAAALYAGRGLVAADAYAYASAVR